ncbi:MAG TPA: nucleotidyltransferase [Bryobacteraceae bacterium]|nr:nucleotidyltransferase [Bryobacteraceae bacterium]
MDQYRVPTHEIAWESLIAPEHWGRYKCVLNRAIKAKVPFALGGGLAVGVYTGIGRYTKDLDLYILPEHRDWVIEMMAHCGLADYYETKPYDRAWIYRAHDNEVIVDSIWAMANKRAVVDEGWLVRGPMIRMFDQKFPVISPEELIWSKLYVLQRDRCDWPDILNLISATGPALDWDHLIDRVAEDQPLIKGVLSVFSWVAPESAAQLPGWVWDKLELKSPQIVHDPAGRPPRPDLLDSRPWFCETLAA